MTGFPARCLLVTAVLLLGLPIRTLAEGESQPIDFAALAEERRENIRKWVVDPKTADRLSDGLEYLEEERYEEARKKILRIPLRRANPHERALVHRVLAFIAVGEDDYETAIAEFEKVLEQQALPLRDESGIRFNVVQLNAVQQKWEAVLAALEQWFRYETDPNPVAYYLEAMAYFQLEQPEKALEPARTAVEATDSPREPWLQLLGALYMMMEDFENTTPILEQLVTRFPKKDYWVRLSLIYGALENYHESLAVQQLAYTQGLLTEDKELRRLVRTYLYQGLPYQAALVLEGGISDGVVENDVEAFEVLAKSWIAARDFDRSLVPLQQAAALAEDGENFVRLGQVYIRREDWQDAVTELQKGLEKGGLKDEGQAVLLVGVALYSDEQPGSARPWFQRALKYDSSRGQAAAWIDLLDRDEAAAAMEAEQAAGEARAPSPSG
jgi:tetratricopeptide (TPR) repeat protein